jgi:hypothetical protein
MDEQQFGRPVLLVVGRLLDPDHRQVPDVYSPVAGSRREDGGIVR